MSAKNSVIGPKSIRKPLQNNRHVFDYLNAYRRMPKVDFAVMITGPWGSGKTMCVRAWTKSLDRKDNDNCPDYLFVSLNGVKTVDEVDSCLFRAAHPFLGGKSAQIAGKMLGTLISGLALGIEKGGTKVDFSLNDLKAVSFDKWIGDAALLVFDDLERCCVDIESLMGYFDDLLMNGKKLILICNEEEMNKRWPVGAKNSDGRSLPSFQEICSKIVGKRFRVEAEIKDLFSLLVDDANCSTELKEFLKNNKDAFVQVFDVVNGLFGNRHVHDYRAFKHALRNLGYWYNKMPKTQRSNEGFRLDFSRAFVLINYALLTHATNREEAFHHGDSDQGSTFDRLMKEGGAAWSLFDSEIGGVPCDLMKRMVFDEKISDNEIKAGVCQSHYFASEQVLNAWQRLLRWQWLEDRQMQDLLKEIQENLRTYKYVAPEEILHVFALLGQLEKYHLLDESEGVHEKCGAYVSHLVKNKKLRLTPEIADDVAEERFRMEGVGFQYAGAFDSEAYFTGVRDIVVKAVREARTQQLDEDLKQMAAEFGTYPGRFYAALQDRGSRLSREPVFAHIDTKTFYQGYCALSNEDKYNVGSILYARAKGNSSSVLSSENTFWNGLIGCLREDLNRSSDGTHGPSGFQKKILYESLNKALIFQNKEVGHVVESVVGGP